MRMTPRSTYLVVCCIVCYSKTTTANIKCPYSLGSCLGHSSNKFGLGGSAHQVLGCAESRVQTTGSLHQVRDSFAHHSWSGKEVVTAAAQAYRCRDHLLRTPHPGAVDLTAPDGEIFYQPGAHCRVEFLLPIELQQPKLQLGPRFVPTRGLVREVSFRWDGLSGRACGKNWTFANSWHTAKPESRSFGRSAAKNSEHDCARHQGLDARHLKRRGLSLRFLELRERSSRKSGTVEFCGGRAMRGLNGTRWVIAFDVGFIDMLLTEVRIARSLFSCLDLAATIYNKG